MRRIALGELAEINPRLSKGAFDSDHVVSFVPMAAVSELSKSIVETKARPYGEVSKGYTYFDNGDLIVAKITPCYENGKMALAEGLAHSPAFGSTEFHVIRPGEQLLGRFLFHLLQSPAVRVAGKSRMKGAAGQKRVPTDFFKELKVPCPPLPEQKRIAAILDAADALRAKRRETLAQLDTMLQSAFLEMFGDPVTNTRGWEVSLLGDVCEEIRNGFSVKQSKGAGGVPISRIETISDGTVDPDKVGFADLNLCDAEKHLLRPGDILFSHINSSQHLCKCAIFLERHGNMVHGMNLLRFRPSRRVLPLFLLHTLKNPSYRNSLMKHENPAVNQSSIAAGKLKNHPVAIPPLEIQSRFSAVAESVERQKSRMRAHLEKLDTLFASLQARAFAGEL